MPSFSSLNGLFNLDLPQNWFQEFEDNVYTFFNEDEFDGVVQISAYFNKSGLFDILKDYKKEKLKHASAKIVRLATYESIYYTVTNNDGNIEHYWITGHKNVKLFCSIILSEEENILVGTKILHSLSIVSI